MWQAKQLGSGSFFRTYYTTQTPETKSWIQKMVDVPVLGNIIGRWIEVSDYGQSEKNKELVEPVKQEKARERIEEDYVIQRKVKLYRDGDASKKDALRELVREVVGESPYKGTRKAKKTRLEKEFELIVDKKRADPNLKSLLYANSNDEKVKLLEEFYKTMSEGEFDDLIKLGKKHKVFSEKVYKEFLKKKKETSRLPVEQQMIANLLKKVDAALIPKALAKENEDAIAAWSYMRDPYFSDAVENKGFISRVKKWFADRNLFNPNKVEAPSKPPQPYSVVALDNGLFRFDYQNRAYEDLKESEVPERLAVWQEAYKTMTGHDWPDEAPDFIGMLAEREKKVTKTAKKKLLREAHPEATITGYNDLFEKYFGDKWADATRVIRHDKPDGSVGGENTVFETTEKADHINYTEKVDKEGNKIPKYVNPETGEFVSADFKGEKLISTDRGLCQIHNGTFYDFKNRIPGKLKEHGIETWDDLLDPEKNIAMMSLVVIDEEQGWCAFYGAPKDLCDRSK